MSTRLIAICFFAALALFFIVLMNGCSSLATQLPSTQACGDVSYVRHGTEVNMMATCEVQGAHSSMEVAK